MVSTCLENIPRARRNRMYVQLRVVLILVVGAGLFLATSGLAQTVQSQTQQPVRPPPSVVATTASLEAQPPNAPVVTYKKGLLTIASSNSTLRDILQAVHKQTGADIDIPPQAEDRVVTRLGPGSARDVVYSLLVASRFNYVIVGSVGHPEAIAQVLLLAKHPAENATQPSVSAASVIQESRFLPTESNNLAEGVQPDDNQQEAALTTRAQQQQMLQHRRQATIEEINQQPK